MTTAQAPVRLVPLVCLKCQSPLPAQPDEVAWVCQTCGQGLLLNETPGLKESGLRPLDVFFSKALQPGKPGRPFWVARGQVTLTDRQTYNGNEERAAREFWSAPHLFYVPAWDSKLEDTVTLGVALLRAPERMEPGSPMTFLPIVTPPSDVRPLAEFMVISIEADRRDALKTLSFDLKLEPAQLWVLV